MDAAKALVPSEYCVLGAAVAAIVYRSESRQSPPQVLLNPLQRARCQERWTRFATVGVIDETKWYVLHRKRTGLT